MDFIFENVDISQCVNFFILKNRVDLDIKSYDFIFIALLIT